MDEFCVNLTSYHFINPEKVSKIVILVTIGCLSMLGGACVASIMWFNKKLMAIGYVVADPFTRAVLSSVLKLNPGPLPFEVHGSLITATAWARRLTSLSA